MPIALFHGFTGDRTSWNELGDLCDLGDLWRPRQPDGAPRPDEAAALDLPGHGRGPSVRRGWRANLESIHDQLCTSLPGVNEGAGELLLIGYSLGARVALGLVAEGLADRAVLISVNPGIDDAERPARRASDATWAALLRDRGVAEFAARWAAQPLFASQSTALDEPARQRRLAQRLSQSAESLAQSLEHMGLAEMPDYRGDLPRLASQLIFVAGEHDPKFRSLLEPLAASSSIPLHLLPASGHDVPLEQPRALAELLARVIPI